MNPDAHRTKRSRRGLAGAAAAGALILLVAYLALRATQQDSGANSANATPSDVQTAMPSATPSIEVTNDEGTSESRLDSRSVAIADGADTGATDRETLNSSSTSASDTPVVEATDSTLERNPSLLQSAISCWKSNELVSNHFQVSHDQGVRTNGRASGTISVDQDQPYPAQLFQTVDGRPLRGKRVEFIADVRARLEGRRAGLRIRVYDAQGRLIAIKQALLMGSNFVDWTTMDVALDIPMEARAISYELIMRGAGQTWIDNARIEVSSSATVATGEILSAARFLPELTEVTARPSNLDFELDAGSTCE